MSHGKFLCACIACVVGIMSLSLVSCGDDEKGEGGDTTAAGPKSGTFPLRATAVDPPPVRTYPSTKETIQGWIDNVDSAKIRAHGWDVWESITTQVPAEGLPVWETWYSGQDIFDPPSAAAFKGKSAQRGFERPSQFHHASVHSAKTTSIPRNGSEEVTSFNRYSPTLGQFIWNHGLNKAATLDSVNAAFNANNTPIVDRNVFTSNIKDSVDPFGIALKPVFQFISGTEPTVIPYWAGNGANATTNPANPTVDSWKQGVVVDPTGKLKVDSTVMMSVNGGPPVPCKVVSLTDFYTVTLTAEDVANFSDFAKTSGDDIGEGDSTDSVSVGAMVKAGNIAVLVAMHVTTKEIPNWTWQTFYWAQNPQDPLYGKDRPASIPAPWSHYNMHVAYYMVIPPGSSSGTPYVSYNPYLESNLSGSYVQNGDTIKWTGVVSNCMSCHRMATWQAGGNTAPYVPNGEIDPADSAFFAGFTKLDFLWSLTRAQ